MVKKNNLSVWIAAGYTFVAVAWAYLSGTLFVNRWNLTINPILTNLGLIFVSTAVVYLCARLFPYYSKKKVQAEAARHKILQDLIDNLPLMIMMIDQQGIIKFVNQFIIRNTATQTNQKNFIGLPYKHFINQTLGEADQQWAEKFLTTEREWVDYQNDRYHLIWMQVTLKDGSRIHIGQDVTNRKRLESDLAVHHEMLQTLIENLPMKILFVDDHGLIRFVNKKFKIKNHSNAIGLTLDEFVSDKFDDTKTRQVAKAALEKSFTWTDLKAVTAGGDTIYDSWITIPFANSSYLAIGHDVTDLKKAEAEKNKMIEQLISQNNDLTQFSFIASHSLRGPIASVLGLINLLDYNNSTTDFKKILELVENSVHKLDLVVRDMNNILELRNVETLKKDYIDTREIIRDVTTALSHQLLTSEAILNVTVNVPLFYTVRKYLHSILFNLLSNAIKFRKTDRKPEIEIAVSKKENNIIFAVKDNGKGIDLERFSDKLFLLYQRFDFEMEGRGIGLFMAKTQAEAIGGKFEVESEPGVGSTFSLIFPSPLDNKTVTEPVVNPVM